MSESGAKSGIFFLTTKTRRLKVTAENKSYHVHHTQPLSVATLNEIITLLVFSFQQLWCSRLSLSIIYIRRVLDEKKKKKVHPQREFRVFCNHSLLLFLKEGKTSRLSCNLLIILCLNYLVWENSNVLCASFTSPLLVWGGKTSLQKY